MTNGFFAAITGQGADTLFQNLGLNNIRLRYGSNKEMHPIPSVSFMGVQSGTQPASNLSVAEVYNTYKATIPGSTLRQALGSQAKIDDAIAPDRIWYVNVTGPWIQCRTEGTADYNSGGDRYGLTLRVLDAEDIG